MCVDMAINIIIDYINFNCCNLCARKVKWEHVHIKVKRIDHLGPYPLDSLLAVQMILKKQII